MSRKSIATRPLVLEWAEPVNEEAMIQTLDLIIDFIEQDWAETQRRSPEERTRLLNEAKLSGESRLELGIKAASLAFVEDVLDKGVTPAQLDAAWHEDFERAVREHRD